MLRRNGPVIKPWSQSPEAGRESTAQNSRDNLPSYRQDGRHCADVVSWREGDSATGDE